MMTEKKKRQIIESGKAYFRQIIIPSHLKNLQALKLKDFKINPFLVNYLAANYSFVKSLFPVYCGGKFWERITGDKKFYNHLAKAFGEVVEEDDTEGKHLVSEIVKTLSADIVEHLRTYAYLSARSDVSEENYDDANGRAEVLEVANA